MPATAYTVHHDSAARRFAIDTDGQRSELTYRRAGDVLSLTHTGVPPALEGRGIAAALVQAALNHARQHGLTVRPLCSYAQAYMQRHPETLDLLAH